MKKMPKPALDFRHRQAASLGAHAQLLFLGIIGSQESSISIKEIMDGKKIFLANLSKGILGEEGTQFLGSLLVTEFQNTTLSRVNIPFTERTPFYLFIDEAHSFMTLSFADILSESRKYGLCLYLTQCI